MVTTKCNTISLDKKISPLVCYFPTKAVLSVLEISDTTLGRHRDDLLKMRVPGFEWHFYQTGCDRTTLEIIWQYTQLVRMYRRSKAKELITQHMEEFYGKTNG